MNPNDVTIHKAIGAKLAKASGLDATALLNRLEEAMPAVLVALRSDPHLATAHLVASYAGRLATPKRRAQIEATALRSLRAGHSTAKVMEQAMAFARSKS